MPISYDIIGDKKVAQQIGTLAGEFGVSVRFLCLEQMKLYVRDVIKKTGGNPKYNLAGQRKEGKAAVESDMNKLFIQSDRDGIEFIGMLDGYAKLQTSGGAIFLADRDNRSWSKDQVMSHHKWNRNPKGRVDKRPNTTYKGLTLVNKRLVKGSKFRQAVAERKRHVGKLKAGWVKALEQLEMATGGKKVSGVPAWIRKQQNDAPQTGLIDNRSKDNVKLKAGNNVRYAGRTIVQSDLNVIGRNRERDLFRSARKRMDQIVERFNKT